MKIFHKLLVLFLALSVVPLGILGYLSIDNMQEMGQSNTQQIEALGDTAVNQSTEALTELGERDIETRADLIAGQVSIYLEENPNLTADELLEDEKLQEIGVQTYGEEGYTAVTRMDTWVPLAHPDPDTEGASLEDTVAEALPDFWAIMNSTRDGEASSGYYDWEDPSGEVRPKYMHVSVVEQETADGVQLNVASTTYIDEFTQPVRETEEAVQNATAESTQRVEDQLASLQNTTMMFVGGIGLLVVAAGFGFAYTISRPVEKLRDQMMSVAEEVSDGEFDGTNITVETDDEIGDLSEAAQKSLTSMKYYINKYKPDEEGDE